MLHKAQNKRLLSKHISQAIPTKFPECANHDSIWHVHFTRHAIACGWVRGIRPDQRPKCQKNISSENRESIPKRDTGARHLRSLPAQNKFAFRIGIIKLAGNMPSPLSTMTDKTEMEAFPRLNFQKDLNIDRGNFKSPRRRDVARSKYSVFYFYRFPRIYISDRILLNCYRFGGSLMSKCRIEFHKN